MLLTSSTTSVVLMDPMGFMPINADSGQPKLNSMQNLPRILQLARTLRIPSAVSWLEQHTLSAPNQPIVALCDHSMPRVVFNACEAGLTDWLLQVGTPATQGNQRSLPKHLQKPKTLTRTQVVMAGSNIHAGLLQTALSLLEEDFDVWLISDLCFCDQQADLEATFDRLASNGVELITASMVAAEWAGRPDHPAYVDWLA